MVRLSAAKSWISLASVLLLSSPQKTAGRRLIAGEGSLRRNLVLKGDLRRKLGKGKGNSQKCVDGNGNKVQCTSSPTSAPSSSPKPSAKPSSTPTTSPTVSPAPSSSPSSRPTNPPTTSPSMAPSPAPTTSIMPSSAPTGNPSSAPTSSPSHKPSLSMAPTDPMFAKTQDENGFDVAECFTSPPEIESSALQTSMLSFDYFVYLRDTTNSTTAQAIADDLEPSIHIKLANAAMDCDYLPPFDLSRLSSAEADIVTGLCPGVSPPEGQTCWKVNAKITTTVYYINARRHLIEAEVVQAIVVWIQSFFSSLADGSDEIFSLEFQGFTALLDLYGEQLADSQTQEEGIGASQALGSNIPVANKNRNGGFKALVVLACGLFVGVALFVFVRRNKRQEEYLKHAEQIDEISLDEEIKADMAHKSDIVNVETDDATGSMGDEEHFQNIEIEDANHDYRTCASPTCSMCQMSQRRPVFISTGKGKQTLAALSPPRHQRNSHRGSRVNDTQVL